MDEFDKHNENGKKSLLQIDTYRIDKHVLCVMFIQCYRLEQKYQVLL